MNVEKYGLLLSIPIEKIDASPFQVRMEYGDITELAENIKNLGLLSPILVRPIDERYEIVHGHRRFMAFQHLKSKYITGIVKELTDKQALIIHGSENIQREGFSPIETARYYERCRKFFSIKEIAREIRKSESHVRYHLYLVNLPEDVQAKIHRGEISYGKARELAKLTRGIKTTAMVGDEGQFIQAPRTTRYFDEIRILARDDSLRDAPSIVKAADLIREGVKVEEAVEEAKKDYAARKLKDRLRSELRPPSKLSRIIIEKLKYASELDRKIVVQYSKIIQEIQVERKTLCPKCEEIITYPTPKLDELVNFTFMDILDAQRLTNALIELLKEDVMK